MIPQIAVKKFLNRQLRDCSAYKSLTEKQLDERMGRLPIQPPIWFRLRKHQKAMFLLGAKLRRMYFAADTGTGKTMLSIALIRYFKRLGIVNTVIVLVPTKIVKYEWAREIAKHSPKTRYCVLAGSSQDKWDQLFDSNHTIVVATHSGLMRMVCDMVKIKKKKQKGSDTDDDEETNGKKKHRLKPNKSRMRKLLNVIDGMVIDECFPMGTLITTPKGKTTIESLKIGDVVTSSLGTSYVKRLIKKQSNVLVRITLENGRIIKATPNHPFLTTDGWVSALSLEGKDVISNEDMRVVWKSIQSGSPIRMGLLRKTILWKIVFSEMASKKQRIKKTTKSHMRVVWYYLKNQTFYIKAFLWMLMLGKMANEPTRGSSESIFRRESTETSDSRKKIRKAKSWKTFLEQRGSYEGNDQRKIAGLLQKSWSYICQSWWEWHGTDGTSKSLIGKTWPWMDCGTSNYDRVGARAKWLSYLLQSRFGIACEKMGNRMRWAGSLLWKVKGKGQETRQQTIGTRVENIAIEKYGHLIDVFDLELEGTPHFCAEGFLVHNSTHVKTFGKLPFRIGRQISKRSGVVFSLSGTPFGNDPTDLWAQMYLVDQGETLGSTLGLFRAAFFNTKVNYWGGYEHTFKKTMHRKLNQMLANRMIEYEANKADLPPVVHIEKTVKLPHDAIVYAERAKRAIIEAHGNYREMQNAFLRMRQISSGFIGYYNDDEGSKAQFEFQDKPKLDLLLSIITGIRPDHKIIVFYEYTYSAKMITQQLDELKIGHVQIYSKSKDHKTLLHRFDHDPKCRVMVLQNSSGFGLNLQISKYTLYFETPVSPIIRKQTERRSERQGSMHNRVFRYDLMVAGTYDQRILSHLAQGKDLFETIIRGKRPDR